MLGALAAADGEPVLDLKGEIAPVPFNNWKIVEQGRGSNWISSSLAAVETVTCGYGVIATKEIKCGELLIVYGGQVLSLDEFEKLSDEMKNFPYQIDDALFFGPRDENDIGIGERINHSCRPNAGFASEIRIVSTRDIAPGEQITIDYATCVSAEHDAFEMSCCCGDPSCRNVVTGEDWQIPGVQDAMYDYFQPYLKRKIDDLRTRRAALLAAVRMDAANTDGT